MKTPAILWSIAFIFACSIGLFTWIAIQAGGQAFAKYRETFTQRTRFQAQEFFLFIDPNSLFLLNVSTIIFGGSISYLIMHSALIAGITSAVLAFLPRFLYARLRSKRLQQFENQLPDALMMLSGALRAGANFSGSLQQLVNETQAPLSQEFTLVLREQRLGMPLETSLNHLAHRVPNPTTILMVSAIRIAQETGGGLAETLERTSHTLRQRLQMEGKIHALTSQGKLQAWVVGMLPIGLMLVLSRLEPDAMSLLWTHRLGWATLIIVAFLECMGIYLIRRIVAIDI